MEVSGIAGYVSATNRGIPLNIVVNRSKARVERLVDTRTRERGEYWKRGEKGERGNSKSFMGKGREEIAG